MGNPFVHVELATTDPATAKEFYAKLFSWKMEDAEMPAGTYTMLQPGEGTGGGLMKQMTPDAPSAWLPYVLVDDIKASTAQAQSLGGSIMMDVTVIDGMGSYSIIVDPTGAALGLWQMA
jgi:uncharacterized protein